MSSNSEPEEYEGSLVHETKRAMLICMNGKDYWIPRSAIPFLQKYTDGSIKFKLEQWYITQNNL